MASLLDTASGDTSKTECHFFRLPRELRDEIYGFIDFRNRQQNLDVLWGSTTMVKVAASEDRIPERILGLISVNRQYLRETLAIFIGQRNFVSNGTLDLGRIIQVSKPLRENITSLVIASTLPFTASSFRKPRNYVPVDLSGCHKLKHVYVDVDAHLAFHKSDHRNCAGSKYGRMFELMVEDLKNIRGIPSIQFRQCRHKGCDRPDSTCSAFLKVTEMEILALGLSAQKLASHAGEGAKDSSLSMTDLEDVIAELDHGT